MNKTILTTIILYAVITLLFGIEGFLTALVLHGLGVLLIAVVAPIVLTNRTLK